MQRAQRFRGAAEITLAVVLDVLLFLAVFKLALYLRLHVLPLLYHGFPDMIPSTSALDHWWVLAIWLFFFSYEGLYTAKLSYWDEVLGVGRASFFAAVGVFAVISLGKLSAEVSRTVIVLTGVLAMTAMPFGRVWAKALLRQWGFFRRRVLVLGAGKTGRLMLRALRKEPNLGYEVVGFLDDDPAKAGIRIEGVKVHRGVDNALRYLRRSRIADVVIAMPGAPRERVQALINSLQHEARRVMFVPDVFGMAVLGTELRHFFEEQAFALEVRNNLARPFNLYTKRLFDYTAGLALLALWAVPIAIIALVIRATSSGPAFFTQERLGLKGKPFPCLKFRTMYTDAEERLDQILASDPVARREYEIYWKLKDDPRVTPVGRFLRRTSLDELPQLINVLRGEMSVVGPRPYLPREEGYLREYKSTILSVLPGITGLWQVSGRSDTGFAYRISLDEWYVRNWNLGLDIVILLKTLRAVFKKEGAL